MPIHLGHDDDDDQLQLQLTLVLFLLLNLHYQAQQHKESLPKHSLVTSAAATAFLV